MEESARDDRDTDTDDFLLLSLLDILRYTGVVSLGRVERVRVRRRYAQVLLSFSPFSSTFRTRSTVVLRFSQCPRPHSSLMSLVTTTLVTCFSNMLYPYELLCDVKPKGRPGHVL